MTPLLPNQQVYVFPLRNNPLAEEGPRHHQYGKRGPRSY